MLMMVVTTFHMKETHSVSVKVVNNLTSSSFYIHEMGNWYKNLTDDYLIAHPHTQQCAWVSVITFYEHTEQKLAAPKIQIKRENN